MDRVLIVEDDKDIAELIRDYFEMNNFNVRLANDGFEGLELSLREDFDIILLDVMLPGIDGFEICRQVRGSKNIPILFVSARDSDIDVIRGLGLGADDYIKKPFIPSELVARAVGNLKRFRALTDAKRQIVIFDECVADLDAMRVTKNGKDLFLANKEFELLAFFIKNPNKVLSRELLFSSVWDYGSYGDINTVTVHIKRLREKIEKDPNHPVLIETVWGAGYRLNM